MFKQIVSPNVDIYSRKPYLKGKFKTMNHKSKQDLIDARFEKLTTKLNSVISHTVPYRFGEFRFTVRQGEDGSFCMVLAWEDWWNQFGKKFQEIASEHGYYFHHINAINIIKITKKAKSVKRRKPKQPRGRKPLQKQS